jgi:hypothetical protein
MKIPGFTADAGLYRAGDGDRSVGRYEVSGQMEHRSAVAPGGILIPLACWIICRAAGGSRTQCLEFCAETFPEYSERQAFR